MASKNLFTVINSFTQQPKKFVNLKYLEETLLKNKNIVLSELDKKFLGDKHGDLIPYEYIINPSLIRPIRTDDTQLLNPRQFIVNNNRIDTDSKIKNGYSSRRYVKFLNDTPFSNSNQKYPVEVFANPDAISVKESYADEQHTRNALNFAQRYPNPMKTYLDTERHITLTPQVQIIPEQRVNTKNLITSNFSGSFNIKYEPRPTGGDFIIMTPKLNVNNIKNIVIDNVFNAMDKLKLTTSYNDGSKDVVLLKKDETLIKSFTNFSEFRKKIPGIVVDTGKTHFLNDPITKRLLQNKDPRKIKSNELHDYVTYFSNPVQPLDIQKKRHWEKIKFRKLKNGKRYMDDGDMGARYNNQGSQMVNNHISRDSNRLENSIGRNQRDIMEGERYTGDLRDIIIQRRFEAERRMRSYPEYPDDFGRDVEYVFRDEGDDILPEASDLMDRSLPIHPVPPEEDDIDGGGMSIEDIAPEGPVDDGGMVIEEVEPVDVIEEAEPVDVIDIPEVIREEPHEEKKIDIETPHHHPMADVPIFDSLREIEKLREASKKFDLKDDHDTPFEKELEKTKKKWFNIIRTVPPGERRESIENKMSVDINKAVLESKYEGVDKSKVIKNLNEAFAQIVKEAREEKMKMKKIHEKEKKPIKRIIKRRLSFEDIEDDKVSTKPTVRAAPPTTTSRKKIDASKLDKSTDSLKKSAKDIKKERAEYKLHMDNVYKELTDKFKKKEETVKEPEHVTPKKDDYSVLRGKRKLKILENDEEEKKEEKKTSRSRTRERATPTHTDSHKKFNLETSKEADEMYSHLLKKDPKYLTELRKIIRSMEKDKNIEGPAATKLKEEILNLKRSYQYANGEEKILDIKKKINKKLVDYENLIIKSIR